MRRYAKQSISHADYLMLEQMIQESHDLSVAFHAARHRIQCAALAITGEVDESGQLDIIGHTSRAIVLGNAADLIRILKITVEPPQQGENDAHKND